MQQDFLPVLLECIAIYKIQDERHTLQAILGLCISLLDRRQPDRSRPAHTRRCRDAKKLVEKFDMVAKDEEYFYSQYPPGTETLGRGSDELAAQSKSQPRSHVYEFVDE